MKTEKEKKIGERQKIDNKGVENKIGKKIHEGRR